MFGSTLTRAALALLLVTSCSSAVTGAGRPAPSSPAESTAPVPSASSFPPSRSSTSVRTIPNTGSTDSSAPAPSPQALLAEFNGTWSGHGRVLNLLGGKGEVSYRVYKWCTDDPTPPCDEMQGNEIIDGGRIDFALNHPYSAGNATIALGVITTSTDLSVGQPGEPFTARVQGYVVALGFLAGAPFCSKNTPPSQWTCGA